MQLWQFKFGVFLLEWLNAFSTSLYFNYLFFYLKAHHGFSSRENLLFCALNGFVYMISAWFGGKFGQKRGYMAALILGNAVMAVAILIQGFSSSVFLHVLIMVSWTLGMSFTWPNLEALIAERETPSHLPKMLGIYNVTWASGSAIAYFTGGAIVEKFGWKSIFWIPVVLHLIQLVVSFGLKGSWHKLERIVVPKTIDQSPHIQHPQAALFLKMAWLANPFAYIAINGAIPLIPELAARLGLTPKFAGFFCSVWFFARMGAFVVLGLWPGWHYRFSWLLGSYIGVIGCFCAMLLLDNLWMVVGVQVLFGAFLGLIYYSSLYYSMDVGEEKGSHGGFHEAALGAGIFAGPAIGALSAYMFPDRPAASIWGIAIVLTIGLFGLLAMRGKSPNH